MAWQVKEQIAFSGIGLTLSTIFWIVSFVVRVREGVRDMGEFAIDSATNVFALAVYAFLCITVVVCWDKIKPWLPWSRSYQSLAIEFDSSYHTCRDVTLGSYVYRVLLRSSVEDKTVHGASVRVVGCREFHRSDGSYRARAFVNNTLQPLNHAGPTFPLNSGVAEPISVVTASFKRNSDDSIYLCRYGADEDRDEGIDSGRYIITLKATGIDAVSSEKSFFVSFVSNDLVFEEFNASKDYSSVAPFKEAIERLIRAAQSHHDTVEHAEHWFRMASAELQDRVALAYSIDIDSHLREIEDGIADRNAGEMVTRGVGYLATLVKDIKDEQLR